MQLYIRDQWSTERRLKENAELRNAIDVLQREPIRLLDGSYSSGSVPMLTLFQMIQMGITEEYSEDGKRFVRHKVV
jgi:hypothetical protein